MTDKRTPMMRFVERLEKIATITSADKDAILALSFQQRELPPGGYLVREGQKPDTCSVLLEGCAIRSKLSDNGSRQIVSVQIPGDIVDLQHLYLERADHNVQALTQVTIAEIPRRDVQALADGRIGFLRAVLIDNAIEASISREWLLNIGRRSGKQRIAHLICEVAVRLAHGEIADTHQFRLPMTQEQLGDATGLTSVHVNRMLKELEQEGSISRTRQQIYVKDWDLLRSTGDFSPSYLHIEQTDDL